MDTCLTKTTFIVPGPPVPCGRPRVTAQGHAFMPERTRKYEKLVRLLAKKNFETPLSGPVFLRVDFFCNNRIRRDVDNLLKSIMDGLNGIAFVDDSQVVSILATKLVSKPSPRAVVTVGSLKSVDALFESTVWSVVERLSCAG